MMFRFCGRLNRKSGRIMDDNYKLIKTQKELQDYANHKKYIYIKERPNKPILEYEIDEFVSGSLAALFTKKTNGIPAKFF